MASIQENFKERKIFSYRFRTCVGRDQNGKQIFKSTTWYPPPELTNAKSRKAAKLAADEWEKQIKAIKISQYLRWLRNDYRTKYGKPLSDKTIKHHYNILGFLCAFKTDLI